MTSKRVFLDRLRAARAAGPRAGDGGGIRPVPPVVRWRIPVADPTAKLAAAAVAVGVQVHLARDRTEGAAAVQAAIAGRSPVLLADHPLVSGLRPAAGPGELSAAASTPESRAAATVAVAPVTAAVAATGSVIVDTDLLRGRTLTLLPPVCVFLVPQSLIVPTPGDVWRDPGRFWPDRLPGQVVWVTGPSRSADIEQTLVPGVHGPGEVHLVLLTGPAAGSGTLTPPSVG